MNNAYCELIDKINSFIEKDAPITPGLLPSSRKLNKLYRNKFDKDKTPPDYIKYIQFRKMYQMLKRKMKKLITR